MPNLEKSSWIGGILGAIFAFFGTTWGIWIYYHPSPAPQVPAPIQTLPSMPIIEPESQIPKVTTGISRKFLDNIFGNPTFDDLYPQLKIRNLIYVFPRFFLQAVISLDGKVVFYSVTTRSSAFRPHVPKLGGRLIETKFAEFGESEHVYSDMTSKYYEYAEKYNLGNAGNYRNIYLGFCPSGASPDWDKFKPAVLDDDGEVGVKSFRLQNAPNCFGVGDINGNEDVIIQELRIGLDYYISRDLPEDRP